jgi:hypothetical protein
MVNSLWPHSHQPWIWRQYVLPKRYYPLSKLHNVTTESPSVQGLRLVASPSQSRCVPFVDMLVLHPPPALSLSQAGLWLVPAIITDISVAHKQLVCGSSARTTLQERRNRTTMADGVCSNQHTNNDIRTRFNAEPYIMQKIVIAEKWSIWNHV